MRTLVLLLLTLTLACGGESVAPVDQETDTTTERALTFDVTVCRNSDFKIVWTAIASDLSRVISYQVGFNTFDDPFWRHSGVFVGTVTHTMGEPAGGGRDVIYVFSAEGYQGLNTNQGISSTPCAGFT